MRRPSPADRPALRLCITVALVAGLAGACRSDDPVLKGGPVTSAAPRAVAAEVRGGQVVGGLQVIVAAVGERVRLSVRSDVADEVVVVDAGLRLAVPAGGVATLEMPTDLPTVHDVRLAGQGLTVARLEVGQ